MATPDQPEEGILAGRTILVLRPEGQDAALAHAIAAAGGRVERFATIRIGPPRDPEVARATLARATSFAAVIFVSTNAVREAITLLAAPWPAAVPALAVGPATASALRAAGVPTVHMPDARFDSEGLLALPALSDVRGRRILIVRGEGGRDLLQTALVECGADVTFAEVYRRGVPDALPAALGSAWRAGQIHAVVALSTEAVLNLLACADEALRPRVLDTPCFVPHPRIAAAVRAAGLTSVCESAMGDDAMVKAMKQFFARVAR